MTRELDVSIPFVQVKVPKNHDATKPIPLKLSRNVKAPNLWATGDGCKVFRDREWAEKSMEMDTEQYQARNAKRIDSSRLVKATVVPEDDCMVTLDGDRYFSDIEEMRDQIGDDIVVDGEPNLPAWCFTTKRVPFDFDLFGSLDCYMQDNHHEDADSELTDTAELAAFWKAWSAKQTVSTYFIDYSRIIVIDQARYDRELAEAKAWLEANPNV